MTEIIKQKNGNSYFTSRQIEIIKNSICRGVSDDEFEIFLMACEKTGLDPFMKQIYAVKRKCKTDTGAWVDIMTIQTGIDGYRVIAERTSCYAPGAEPTYTYKENGSLESASAYVKKQTKDGTWHIVSACAYMDEYLQTYHDKSTGQQKAKGMWGTMPRTMLAKCAESIALRKAFPAEMSGLYTKEEMDQADNSIINKINVEPEQIHVELTIGEKKRIEELKERHGIENVVYSKYIEKISSKCKKSHDEVMKSCLENEEKFVEVFNKWLEKSSKEELVG